jgi:hypothetical protein
MGRNNIAFIVIGASALAIGIALRLFVGRRRFYRRNQAGLQGFKNYRSAIALSFIEKLLMFVGSLLIIIGILFFIVALFIGE